LERASGTTRRNSRRPRALRRSRMAFIRAAGNAIKLSYVTRYSVTRYVIGGKFHTTDKPILEETYRRQALFGRSQVSDFTRRSGCRFRFAN
jgi:hypothetical protein